MTWYLRSRILSTDDEQEHDVEAMTALVRSNTKGKAREAGLAPETWVESGCTTNVDAITAEGQADMQHDVEGGLWWKLWEISAACKDIGGMECYGQSYRKLPVFLLG